MSLLTEDYQKIVRREKKLRLFAYLFFLLSVAGAVGLVFMLPSYFLLVFSKDDYLRRLQIEEEVLARKELGKLEGRLSQVNSAISAFELNESKRRSASELLIRLFRSTPPEVRIFSMDLRRDKTGQFALNVLGNADSREDFLRYVSVLESSPDYAGVVSPISNLLAETNVEFNLELKLKPEIYKYE